MRPISEMMSFMDIKKETLKIKVLYPRQELIKKFVDRINADRAMNEYRPLTPKFIATKMYSAQVNTDFLLNWFYGYCDDAKNFSKCWWWSLNSKSRHGK